MKREADMGDDRVRGIEAAIEADDLNRALELLKALVEPIGPPWRSDAILLKSRYSELRRDDRSGILSFQELSLMKTKLKRDILTILEEIECGSLKGD